ncbi:hypothetical protein BJ878DRAFT_520761 [Calycina marina]|uniref:Uncharacterized protein n=1 Tax=Calycina marina TaxID=1763456 RepID=A0A9P7YX38_9HELO|nr:hypothetical protein BJ878DRAFT_520761 [Calycina marina]
MDFLNKAKEQLSNSSGSTGTTGNTAAPTGGATAPAGQTQDYGDKAFDFVSKKSGHDFAPGTDEKITDGARGMYEKATGNKVDPKYSN